MTLTPLTLRSIEVTSTAWCTLRARGQALAPRIRRLSSTLARASTRRIRAWSLLPCCLIIWSRTLTTTRSCPLPRDIRLVITVSRWCRPVHTWTAPATCRHIISVLKGWSTQLDVFRLKVWCIALIPLLSETTTIGTLLSTLCRSTVLSMAKLLTLATRTLSSIMETLAGPRLSRCR